MSRDLMISMLRKGENGDEILQILETLTQEDDAPQPTLDEIQF